AVERLTALLADRGARYLVPADPHHLPGWEPQDGEPGRRRHPPSEPLGLRHPQPNLRGPPPLSPPPPAPGPR
ncbi:hypothetical protein ABZ391_22575, partial [Kitasatospora cineracea]